MELFDSISNILSLLFGGSLISIITWKFARRKAAAEAKQAEALAKQAEAEAKKAEAEAMKEKQDYYQQMAEDIAKDRDYYKQDRDNQRGRLDEVEEEMRKLQSKVDFNTRVVRSIIPFVCLDPLCKKRKRAAISPNGELNLIQVDGETEETE